MVTSKNHSFHLVVCLLEIIRGINNGSVAKVDHSGGVPVLKFIVCGVLCLSNHIFADAHHTVAIQYGTMALSVWINIIGRIEAALEFCVKNPGEEVDNDYEIAK